MSLPNSPFRKRGADPDQIFQVTDPLFTGHVWDSGKIFFALGYDGESIRVEQTVKITDTVHPRRLPTFLIRSAGKLVRQQAANPERRWTVYAFGLLAEAHAVAQNPDLNEWDAAVFRKDTRERNFHKRADAVEIRDSSVVDIEERIYKTFLTRGKAEPTRSVGPFGEGLPEGVREVGLPPVIRALALAAGHILWGDPVPAPAGSDRDRADQAAVINLFGQPPGEAADRTGSR